MIPFIRAFPDGHQVLSEIERPSDIQALANRFIAHGGRYLVAVLSDEEVRLVAATMGRDGETVEMASEVTANGPAILDAVDRLVRNSLVNLDLLQ